MWEIGVQQRLARGAAGGQAGVRDGLAQLARLGALVVVVTILTACVRADPYHLVEQPASSAPPRVLLMPPDVTVIEVGSAGVPLPRADWTSAVEDALVTETREILAKRGAELVRYESPGEGVTPYREADIPAVHMHQSVLQAVLAHHYASGGATGSLPAEAPRDWTLGASVTPLRDAYDADFAMFLLYRQATTSVGRTVLNTLQLVLFGYPQANSRSVGFASLVDLETGAVVWTNLVQGNSFDANEPDNLPGRTRKLLRGVPL